MLTEADIRSLSGLTEEEAARRLAAEGLNELPSAKGRGVPTIVWEVAKEPMFLLLVAAGSLYLLLGELSDALLLLFFVLVVMGITIYQERKTERALAALRDLSSPRALVIRGGEQRRIPGREVARGDLFLLAEGDRVPADALLLWTMNLTVDESLLTGESVPVRKRGGESGEPVPRPGGEDLPFVWSGTLVTAGQAVAEAVAIGAATELGSIGKSLAEVESGQTPLQEEMGRLVRGFALLGISLCVVVVGGYGLTRGDWMQGLLAGLAMAMSVLPEEIPVILTIFLTLGAWRMSKRRVLTRRVPAVEVLGSATVLCVDKTGTLTHNHMSVARVVVEGHDCRLDGEGDPLPEACHRLLEHAILASKRDPFDPMEKALHRLGTGDMARHGHLHPDWELVREYPLSRSLLALSHVWRGPGGRDGFVVAAKGAPEAMADLCHLGEGERARWMEKVHHLAAGGLRVIAVARADLAPGAPGTPGSLPGDQHDIPFLFLGLVGMADPVRASVPAAVAECYAAGVRVVMITGDYPETARNIARGIGLRDPETVITGPELDRMGDAELASRVGRCDIFARVVPEQKLRLVQALKAAGEVVAMTGDGVNDAPALRAAHIGVAMGGRGTDVARESASLVLLDDDFSSIVAAVRHGRRIYDNIRKALVYTLAIHVPIAGLSLLPVLLGWPLILLPVHIVFLELIIDPSCSVVFEGEGEEPGIMERPPRPRRAPVFDGRTLGVALLQGLAVLGVAAGVFALALGRGGTGDEARTMAYTTLILANLGLILANRSLRTTIVGTLSSRNPALWWVVGGALALLALVLGVPFLRTLFHFAPLSAVDLLLALGAAALSIGWFEGMKAVRGAGAGGV